MPVLLLLHLAGCSSFAAAAVGFCFLVLLAVGSSPWFCFAVAPGPLSACCFFDEAAAVPLPVGYPLCTSLLGCSLYEPPYMARSLLAVVDLLYNPFLDVPA